MSIHKNYSIKVGDKLILNDEYKFTDVYGSVEKGAVFRITGIREKDDYLEYESEKEYEHSYRAGGLRHKIKGAFHITSNVATWFDEPMRDANLKALLD